MLFVIVSAKHTTYICTV